MLPVFALRTKIPTRDGKALPALLALFSLLALHALPGTAATPATPILPFVTTSADQSAVAAGYEGQVEAVRQTVLSAQVPGSITLLQVRAGDRVRAGQVLARIDARAAEQGVAAGTAQVEAARANLNVAAAELERKRQLFAKNYIAKAALEQAEAVHKAAQAQVNALSAQTSAAQAQTGFHVVRAPYNGVVAAVSVELGDMAMPGRPLVSLYDPSALRVSAAVPATAAGSAAPGTVRIELTALGEAGRELKPVRVQVLPTVDPQSMTREVRADLPAGLAGAVPGQYARLWIAGATPVREGGNQPGLASVRVPATAVIRRAEVNALYVLDAAGRPVLRLVRLGRSLAGQVEVLAGVEPGERVVTDPQAAARVAAAPVPAQTGR